MTKWDELGATKRANELYDDLEGLELQVAKSVSEISNAGDSVAASVQTAMALKNADGSFYFDAADKKQVYDKLKAIKPYLTGLIAKIDAITAPIV
jgi:regulator of replication initiation timing